MGRLGKRRVTLWLLATGVIVVLVLGVTKLQRAMLFPRDLVRPVPAVLRTPGLERWWLETSEGRVEAFFLPGDGVDADHPGPAVLFTHGNAELIDLWPQPLAPYRRMGVSLVLAEYPGYGRSEGTPSEASITETLRALHARIMEEPSVDPTRLVHHGRSLGGGAIGTLLRDHPPRALVLESTFTSVPDVAAGMHVPRFLIVDRFETLDAIGAYDGPLLVFHGTRDSVIPVSHGRRLAAAHPSAELVIYDCGHNDLPPPGSDYWPRIERFLQDAGVITASRR